MSLSQAPQAPPADQPKPVPLPEAYHACVEIARRHYENFPVATRFLSPDRRLALAAIYAFARQADDLADADAPVAERLHALDEVERALLAALDGAPEGPVFTALADAGDRHRLPSEPFLDLLGYCRGSANTIGRLVLATHGIEDPVVARHSDDVCTALQLTNFWQDLGRDLARGRVFLPEEDLARFGLQATDLERPSCRGALSRLLEHECRATEDLYRRGAAVVREVPFGLSLQLRATIAGGRIILRSVLRSGWRVLLSRPALGTPARVRVLLTALLALDG